MVVSGSIDLVPRVTSTGNGLGPSTPHPGVGVWGRGEKVVGLQEGTFPEERARVTLKGTYGLNELGPDG